VASDKTGVAKIDPAIMTGSGEFAGPIRYMLSLRLNPPLYVPGDTKIQTGVVGTKICDI
jgi:hypothetical protein